MFLLNVLLPHEFAQNFFQEVVEPILGNSLKTIKYKYLTINCFSDSGTPRVDM